MLKTLKSVELRMSSIGKPLAIAYVEGDRAIPPIYVQSHDLAEIRKAMASRRVVVPDDFKVDYQQADASSLKRCA